MVQKEEAQVDKTSFAEPSTQESDFSEYWGVDVIFRAEYGRGENMQRKISSNYNRDTLESLAIYSVSLFKVRDSWD